jgi:hypothetical protein
VLAGYDARPVASLASTLCLAVVIDRAAQDAGADAVRAFLERDWS